MTPSVQTVGWGKAILLGEHAVIYGARALVTALDIGVRVHAEPSAPGAPVELVSTSRRDPVRPNDGSELGRALEAILRNFPGCLGVRLVIESTLPVGVGLGSSAALAVAVTRAFATVTESPLSPSQVAQIANDAESVFHGQASGVDVAAASLGGLLLYRKGVAPEPVATQAALPLVLAVIGSAPPTGQMVDRVRRLRLRDHARVEHHVTAIDALTERGLGAVAKADWKTLGACFNENHERLCDLGVSAPELDAACHAARAAGALGAKLTGAGGGGCVIALAPDHRGEVLQTWTDLRARPVG